MRRENDQSTKDEWFSKQVGAFSQWQNAEDEKQAATQEKAMLLEDGRQVMGSVP